MRKAIYSALALGAIAAGTAPAVEQEPSPAYTAELVELPRAARQYIFQANDLLKKRATRIFSGSKAVLDVWLPSYVPPADGLFDGSLLVILAPPERPRPQTMVTVRTMEKGARVDFATIEREGAQRNMLELRRPLKTWRRLDETQALALVGAEEPLWLELPPQGPRATLHEEAGELYITLALQAENKRGVRWQVPPRIRKILGL